MFTKSIIVPLVIFIIYLFYKLFIKPKLKRPKIATIIEVGIVLILLPLYQIYLQDYVTKDEKKKDKAFKESLLAATEEQGFKIEKYKERIKEMHKQTYQSSDEDAEKWAVNFLSTVNIRKDKIKQQKEEARIIKEKELIRLLYLFYNIGQQCDNVIYIFTENF